MSLGTIKGKMDAAQSRANVTALIAAGQVIEFHNPRGLYDEPIIFPAFLTSFSDNVTAEFVETNTYGRMDPIYSFQNTKRQIDFAIDIPAEDATTAQENLQKVKRLQSLLYPSYAHAGAGDHYIISTAPLFQIKFNNLIEDEQGTNGLLLGIIPGLNFTPEMEPGMFYEGSKFYPKLIKLSVTFKPLHAGKARGWGEDGHAISTFSDTGWKGGPNTAGPTTPTANTGVTDDPVAQARAADVIAASSGGTNDDQSLPKHQSTVN